MWRPKPRARPSTAGPRGARDTRSASRCANGSRKSSAGPKPSGRLPRPCCAALSASAPSSPSRLLLTTLPACQSCSQHKEKQGGGSRPQANRLREASADNAVLLSPLFQRRPSGVMYVLSTGCQWRALPKDLPPRSTVHGYLDLWNWDGTLERIHHAVYVKCREKAEREASPTAAIIDSQSVKSAEKGGVSSTLAGTMRARKSKARSVTSLSTRKAC